MAATSDESRLAHPDPSRRQFLKLGSTLLPLSAAASSTLLSTAQADTSPNTQQKTQAKIVIVGSGLGGLAAANRLHRELDGAKITIIDRKQEHNYQPGYTLVATGVWSKDKVRDRNRDFIPSGVEWIQEMVVGFEPEKNRVRIESGKTVDYDYMIIATGLQLNYTAIEGMDIKAIGDNGLGSVYYSPDAAEATWKAMDQFRQKGGQAIMTLPNTFLKCAGAPLKMTFMLDSRLREAGTRKASKIDFYSALKNIFSVKVINDEVLKRWQALDIPVHFEKQLTAIDIAARKASFLLPNGQVEQREYDFIHVVPPMSAPDVIRQSVLASTDGVMAKGGWLEVDKKTLQHKRFPNIFGLGDINGTPRGKTAATIKKSAPIVVQNLLDVMAGKSPSLEFDGYTSCPLLLREGAALLVEFDGDGNLTPSLPMIEPLQDSWMAWLMKYRLLKPAYLSVLKGRV